MKRIMIAALAAVGLLAATPGIANATDDPGTASTVEEGTASAGTPGFVSAAEEPGISLADEWYTSSTNPTSKGYGYVGAATSTSGGVWQVVDMWRENNYVALYSGISDDKEDGYCAGAEIRYQVYNGSTWSGYHYRMIPHHDCTHDGKTVWGGYYYSRPRVGNVSSRACHVNSSGAKIECEKNWHGPI
ncbi:hypothetical protein ACFY19_29130 [Streptosporangium saharense]|uniref:hypothetical protein n=1 Tax=Streptosporangium saharense TaxID=1706840 RepID=UPI0036B86555